MVSINATLIVQLILFLIIVFLLNRIMIQPILKLISERDDHVKNMNREIQHTEEETQRLVREYLEKENEARKEAVTKAALLKQEGIEEVVTYIEEAEKEALSTGEEILKKVTAEIETIRPTLKGEAEALVDELVEKMVGRRISA